uniref:Uncharacterized protein n=1 Tax=Physcomitrium patens TaxID=3218 RepID=A0A2K1IB75_PHYPA|nr:hypothetical protein PHYPA_031082 [Physcomitrium patens]
MGTFLLLMAYRPSMNWCCPLLAFPCNSPTSLIFLGLESLELFRCLSRLVQVAVATSSWTEIRGCLFRILIDRSCVDCLAAFVFLWLQLLKIVVAKRFRHLIHPDSTLTYC